MHTRHLKFITILRVTLLTILFSAVFHRPGVSQSSPDGPYDVFLPLLSSPYYTPLPDIHNGDFEHGDNGDWTVYSSNDYYLITHDLLPITPRSGSWLAWMGGVPEEDSRISQRLSLPSDSPIYLRYYYQVDSFGQDSCTQDWMFLLVGSTELASLWLCEASDTSAWEPGTINLNAYAGQTITVTFQVTTSVTGTGSAFFIDDVSLTRSP